MTDDVTELLRRLVECDPWEFVGTCDDAQCFFCGGEGHYDFAAKRRVHALGHDVDCPWVEARAHLATLATAPVAQGSEPQTHNLPDAGSSPARRTDDLTVVGVWHNNETAGVSLWCNRCGDIVEPPDADDEPSLSEVIGWADAHACNRDEG